MAVNDSSVASNSRATESTGRPVSTGTPLATTRAGPVRPPKVTEPDRTSTRSIDPPISCRIIEVPPMSTSRGASADSASAVRISVPTRSSAAVRTAESITTAVMASRPRITTTTTTTTTRRLRRRGTSCSRSATQRYIRSGALTPSRSRPLRNTVPTASLTQSRVWCTVDTGSSPRGVTRQVSYQRWYDPASSSR